MEARAELLEPLGLKPVEVLLGEHPIGTRIEADRTGATVVPGVWVAGNLADPRPSHGSRSGRPDDRRRDQLRPGPG